MRAEDDCGFFHVCTNGTVLPWMFKDTEDFVYGVNRIGICCLISDISVLVYSLMDNHVHFLLYGSLDKCHRFIYNYKFLTGKWISHKYKISKYLKNLPVSIIPLQTEEDLLETAVYIDRNAIMAGFDGLPYDYPWSSCKLMFRKSDENSVRRYRIRDFSRNALREILKSRVEFPDDWTFDEQFMLDPMCFTKIKMMEKAFKSSPRYLYFLTKKLEGKINQALAEYGNRSFVSDKDLREITERLAFQMFRSREVRTLNVESRLKLARKLKHDYASSPKQIARMLHLEANLLKDFI